MIPLLSVLILAFALGLALVPAARVLGQRFGLVDHPDGHRKMHSRSTPVSGGPAILLAVVVSLAIAAMCFESLGAALLLEQQTLLGLLLGSAIICVVGMIDDRVHLRGRYKVLGQLVAVGVVIGMGGWVKSAHVFGVYFDLGWLAIPATVFLMLGAINSLNLIDGMDGLLGSVGLILSLALAAMALLAGHVWAATVALALAGALLGFLRHNLPPASIFLGDSGSMLIGLVLGTLTIQGSLKAPATLALAMPVALLILPIFDTTAAIVRRKLTGRSIYTTDRGHLHHCLLRRGLSTSWALAVVAGFCIIACCGVLASQAFNHEWIALVTAASIVAILITTRLFGHAEIMLIKCRLWSLLRPAQGASHMEVRLQGSAAWKDLWHSLKHRADELNLKSLVLDVNAPALHEGYHARWDQAHTNATDERPHWHVEIPMTAQGVSAGRLVLEGRPDSQPVWAKIAIVMKEIDEFNLARSDTVTDASALSETVVYAASAARPSMPPLPAVPSGLGVEVLQS